MNKKTAVNYLERYDELVDKYAWHLVIIIPFTCFVLLFSLTIILRGEVFARQQMCRNLNYIYASKYDSLETQRQAEKHNLKLDELCSKFKLNKDKLGQ